MALRCVKPNTHIDLDAAILLFSNSKISFICIEMNSFVNCAKTGAGFDSAPGAHCNYCRGNLATQEFDIIVTVLCLFRHLGNIMNYLNKWNLTCFQRV